MQSVVAAVKTSYLEAMTHPTKLHLAPTPLTEVINSRAEFSFVQRRYHTTPLM